MWKAKPAEQWELWQETYGNREDGAASATSRHCRSRSVSTSRTRQMPRTPVHGATVGEASLRPIQAEMDLQGCRRRLRSKWMRCESLRFDFFESRIPDAGGYPPDCGDWPDLALRLEFKDVVEAQGGRGLSLSGPIQGAHARMHPGGHPAQPSMVLPFTYPAREVSCHDWVLMGRWKGGGRLHLFFPATGCLAS